VKEKTKRNFGMSIQVVINDKKYGNYHKRHCGVSTTEIINKETVSHVQVVGGIITSIDEKDTIINTKTNL